MKISHEQNQKILAELRKKQEDEKPKKENIFGDDETKIKLAVDGVIQPY